MKPEPIYTPAPWNVSCGNMPGVYFVTEAYAKDIHGMPENNANARLISAAPDLLVSLKDALGAVESMHERVGSVVTSKRLEACRAAIANAEGN